MSPHQTYAAVKYVASGAPGLSNNRCGARTIIARETAELLVDHDPPVLGSTIGQRVGKVMTTLKFIEDHVGRVLDEIKNARPTRQSDEAAHYLHGPRLDSDRGHITQSEIDALFGQELGVAQHDPLAVDCTEGTFANR